MRRKKASCKAAASRPLSAYEAGKTSSRGGKQPSTGRSKFKYDDDGIYIPAEPLTVREEEILSYLADDQSNEEIANREKIATSTVEKHIENIYSKIPVNSRASAVSWYWKRRVAQIERRRRSDRL